MAGTPFASPPRVNRPLLFGALLLSSLAFGQADELPSPGSELLGDLHEVDLIEMHIGALAEARGTTPEVRRFGTLIYRDHRLADGMVVRLAQDFGFAYAPLAPVAQTERDVALLRELEDAHGAEFDTRFLASTVALDHGAALASRAAERRVTRGDVRGLVDTLVPILDQHVAIAKQLRRGP